MPKFPNFDELKNKLDDLKKIGDKITDKAKSAHVFDKFKSMINPDAVSDEKVAQEVTTGNANDIIGYKISEITGTLELLLETHSAQGKVIVDIKNRVTALEKELKDLLQESIRQAALKKPEEKDLPPV